MKLIAGVLAAVVVLAVSVATADAATTTYYQATPATRDSVVGVWGIYLNPAGWTVSTDGGAEGDGPEPFLIENGNQFDASPTDCVFDACFAQATGVNGTGQISGWAMYDTNSYADQAYRYDSTTQTWTLLQLNSEAYSINAAGQMVGGYRDAAGNERAFLWDGTTFKDLGTLGGAQAVAVWTSGTGQAVGCAQTKTGAWHPFRYAAGKMHDLGLPPGLTQGCAYSSNENGQIIGGDGIGPWEGFWSSVGGDSCNPWSWTPRGGYVTIPKPAGVTCVQDFHVDLNGVVALSGGYSNPHESGWTWKQGVGLAPITPANVPFGDLQRLLGAGPFVFAVNSSNINGQLVASIGAYQSDDEMGVLLSPLHIYDENDPALHYSGAWSRVTSTGAWGGKVEKAGSAGGTLSFTFTGKTVSVIVPFSPGLGFATITLDGGSSKTVNENQPTAARRRVYFKTLSTAGMHTLQISASAGFEVDALTTTQY
jgi:probable HAF family extracellular repeat protein